MQRFCAGGRMLHQTKNLMATSQFLVPTQQRNFGANEKALKIRMKSVNSIKKITKAMKMVATAKMKGDLTRLAAGKNFGVGALDTMFAADAEARGKQATVGDGSQLLVPITSDKGMCGAINSGVIRNIRDYLADKDRSKINIFSIGDKGTVGMQRRMGDMLRVSISEIQTPYNYPTAMALAENIIQASEQYNSDKITIVYNEFVSAISTNILHLELMTRKNFIETMAGMYIYKKSIPDKNVTAPALYDLYVTSNLWVALLNNAASEQSARMNAMENASKNAGEILDALTLQYNKARQARITMELVEIISGASAL